MTTLSVLATLCLTSTAIQRATALHERLTSEELGEILRRASQTQAPLATIVATFATEYIDPNLDSTPIHRSLQWARSGQRERLDVAFDLPAERKRGAWEKQLFIRDSKSVVNYLPRTRQAAITRPSQIPYFTPADWLFPRFRATFLELLADEAVTLAGASHGDGDVFVSIEKRLSDGSAARVTCTLSKDLEYAVSRWESDGECAVDIEYGSTDGRILPVRAIFRVLDRDSRKLRRQILVTREISIGSPEFPDEPHVRAGVLPEKVVARG